MVETLIISIIALAALKGRKQKGVGKLPKRRIFAEIATAQGYSIDFSMPYDDTYSGILKNMAQQYNFHPSARSSKSTAEQYFNSLRRAYNAVSGIGATNLPYRQSEIKNENGDVIVTYKDYGTPEQKLQDAIAFIEEIPFTDQRVIALRTEAYIAGGGKLVWKNKKVGGQLIGRGVEDILRGGQSERKARISYLGAADKGALTLDQLAHQMWESGDMQDDDSVIYDGIEQAILLCESRGQAIKDVLDFYYDAHRIPDMPEYDTPF